MINTRPSRNLVTSALRTAGARIHAPGRRRRLRSLRATRFWALAAFVVLALPTATLPPVQAAPNGGLANGIAPPRCAYAVDNGCAGANPNGSFKPANLINAVTQSGQNSLLGKHPMNFNVPAVDYPIGPDKMLTPKDPRTINDGVCAWDAALMRVLCGGSGLYHEVLNNIDFCGSKIGKAPVYLYANSGPQAGSTLTITNSYFCLQPDPRGTGGFGQLKIGFGPPSHWSIIYKNNQCDGASSNLTTGFCIDDLIDAPGTSIDMEYNAFTHQVVARVGGGVTNAAWIFKYNFVEGLNDINNPLSPHGEVMEMNCSGNRGGCNSSQSYEGNFLIWDPPTVAGMNNTTFFPSDGAPDKVTLSSVRIVNNVVVANAGGGGTIPAVDQVLMTVNSVKTLGNVTITGNWIDASGTGSGCSIIGDKSTQGTVTAQQSGTVINITSTGTGFRNLPIEPGWQFWRGGIREATITSMGTNRGKTGTVNVDTSANIPSDSSWTLVPGWNSLTQAGNMLLNDPSRTGSPTAMTISGPAMIGAPCF